jgi:pimeloyl-ACP methyl ester carboxylesterase
MLRSWYVLFFQLPYLPELLLSSGDFRPLERGFRGMVRRRDREVFTDHDLNEIKQAFRPPGAPTAAVNYYRAGFRNPQDLGRYDRLKIASPTLLIWAEEDTALRKELTYGMEPLFSGPFEIAYIPDCSHWVQQEQPERVNALLLDFLGRA